jgi:hypothetical protein
MYLTILAIRIIEQRKNADNQKRDTVEDGCTIGEEEDK